MKKSTYPPTFQPFSHTVVASQVFHQGGLPRAELSRNVVHASPQGQPFNKLVNLFSSLLVKQVNLVHVVFASTVLVLEYPLERRLVRLWDGVNPVSHFRERDEVQNFPLGYPGLNMVGEAEKILKLPPGFGADRRQLRSTAKFLNVRKYRGEAGFAVISGHDELFQLILDFRSGPVDQHNAASSSPTLKVRTNLDSAPRSRSNRSWHSSRRRWSRIFSFS